MHRYLLSIFLLLVLGTTAQGQKIDVSEAINLRNDYGYEVIGRLRDRILLFRDRYDDYEIQAFDLQLQASWSRTLDDLDRRNTRILSVIPGKNDFSVLFAQKIKGKYFLRIHKYDPSAVMIDSMTIKNFGERLFTPPEFEVLQSEDRTKVVVYNTAERQQLECVSFHIDLMRLIWDKTAHFEEGFQEEVLSGLAMDNQGTLYVALDYNNRKSKLEEHVLKILRISGDNDIITSFPLTSIYTGDLKMVYDHLNSQLLVGGLWGDRNRERANGGFYLRCNPMNQADFVFKKTAFDDKFISTLRQKDVSDDSKGIEDADVAHVLPRTDGGLAVICERHYDIQRGTTNGSRFAREIRNIVDYYYDDFFILSFAPDGTLQWNTALHKKQYSQDDDGIFSSFFVFKGSTEIQFLFNDEIRYENSCSVYALSANGKFDRNSLMNTVNQGLRLRFRDGVQMSADECLIPSEYRGKLKLVRFRISD